MECTLNRFTLLPTASDAANFQAASGYTSCQLSPSGNSGAAIGGESEPVPVTCTDFYCHVVGVGPIAWLRAVQYTSLTWLSVSGEVQTSPPPCDYTITFAAHKGPRCLCGIFIIFSYDYSN